MKYFIDTEFIDGPQKESFPISLFRKETPNTIDLISIGIIAEDGREYYAVSKDFNLKEAWNRWQQRTGEGDRNNIEPRLYWLRENVLKPIYYELIGKDIGFHDYDRFFTYKALKNLINKKGKTNKEIANKIKEFCSSECYIDSDKVTPKEWEPFYIGNRNRVGGGEGYSKIYRGNNPEFYAYYADYDWVVFCWLFGKMIDLPKGFPMYCKDLKQMLDDKVDKYLPYTVLENQRQGLDHFKTMTDFPKQDSSKSHNAIEDARWNKQLFEFLTQL